MCWHKCWKTDPKYDWFNCKVNESNNRCKQYLQSVFKGKGTGWTFLLLMLYVLLSPFLIIFTLLTFLGLILCSLGQTSSAEELQKGIYSISWAIFSFGVISNITVVKFWKNTQYWMNCKYLYRNQMIPNILQLIKILFSIHNKVLDRIIRTRELYVRSGKSEVVRESEILLCSTVGTRFKSF